MLNDALDPTSEATVNFERLQCISVFIYYGLKCIQKSAYKEGSIAILMTHSGEHSHGE